MKKNSLHILKSLKYLIICPLRNLSQVLVAYVIILANWRAEIGKLRVWNQPRLIVLEIPAPKQLEQNGL
jgi:hypothetical protein